MLQPQIWRYGSLFDQFPGFFRQGREMRPFSSALTYGVDFPPMNVWLGQENAIVAVELPGVEQNELDISIIGNTLKISGSRPAEKIGDRERCYQQERSTGSFARSLQLPFQVDAAHVEAKYERGILEIVVPRSEADKPKKISVKKD